MINVGTFQATSFLGTRDADANRSDTKNELGKSFVLQGCAQSVRIERHFPGDGLALALAGFAFASAFAVTASVFLSPFSA